jgi:hypothetical protein
VRTPSKHQVAKSKSTSTETKKPLIQTNSQPPSKSSALNTAESFDLNTLSPAELELNYKPKLDTTLEYPIRKRYITDDKEKLKSLKAAKINVTHRLASDPPEIREARQYLLNNINSEITELTERVAKVRNQNSAISI